METLIRWKKGDYIKLGKAVSEFNKKIKMLQNEENKLYLPEEISYQNIKQDIMTRKELNRIINSLRRFQREGAENLYTTEAGEQMTRWERRELGIQSRLAQIQLKKELEQYQVPTPSGFTRAEMGAGRPKEIEKELKRLKSFETKTGWEFKSLGRFIKRTGVSDYKIKKASVYRQNYMKMLENYKNFKNYNKLVDFFDKKLKNPIKFYEYVKGSNELLADITYMYDFNNYGMKYVNSEDKFNLLIKSLGIEVDETEDIKGEISFKYFPK